MPAGQREEQTPHITQSKDSSAHFSKSPRCAYATERCRQETPQLTPVSDKQSVRCFRAAELAQKEANAQ